MNPSDKQDSSSADTSDVSSRIIHELMPDFLAHSAESLSEMREALSRGDLGSLAKTAHRFAGSCSTFGFTQLSSNLKTIESLAKLNSPVNDLKLLLIRTETLIDECRKIK